MGVDGMDRNVDDEIREATMEERAARILDSLDLIDRATRNGCSSRALQDIVGNLLVLLAWLDEATAGTQPPLPLADPRVRSLIVDCLAVAGVPAGAIPSSLGVIRDCVLADDGMLAEGAVTPIAPERMAD